LKAFVVKVSEETNANATFIYHFMFLASVKTKTVISLNQPRVCQQKWLWMEFEAMPSCTNQQSHTLAQRSKLCV